MDQVGGYKIKRELARGNMGVVYLAVDPGLERDVAVKLIRSSLSKSSTLRKRFQREAQALARLHHPNVLRVHAFGDHEGQPYIVMELLDGESLQARLEREGQLIDEREAAEIGLAVARALVAAHEHGLLHRDVKPDNVILASDGPRLTDFGLARDQEASGGGLTKAGIGLGTPGYWPPEQATGNLAKIGPASDVYGVGATIYAMLAGNPPISARTAPEVLAALKQRPESLSKARSGIDPRLDAICLKCLEPTPEMRYPRMKDLVDDLERYLRDEAVEAGGVDVAGRLGTWLKHNQPVAIAAGVGTLAVIGVLAVGLALAQPADQPTERNPPRARAATPAPPPPVSSEPRELSEVTKRAWKLAKRKASEGNYDASLEQYRFLLSQMQGAPLRTIQVEAARVLVDRGLAAAYGKFNLPASSQEDFEKAAKLAPKSSIVRVAIGRAYYEHARRSIEATPEESEHAEWDEWREKRARRQLVPARRHLRTATALDPVDGEAWQLLGASLHLLGSHTEAIRAFDRSSALLPDHAESLLYCGASRMNLEDPKGAVADFNRAKAACGDAPDRITANVLGRILLERAKALLLLDRRADAREDCLRVLELFEGTTGVGARASKLLRRIDG